MSVTSSVSADGRRVTIAVTGRFDFSVHREFRAAYRERGAVVAEFEVDLAAADYMDSSALGMLLLLREHAAAGGGRVTLRRPTEGVRRVLAIANFDRLFAIE